MPERDRFNPWFKAPPLIKLDPLPTESMPLIRDLIDAELEDRFKTFVRDGGLDQPQSRVVDEGWERVQRRTYCQHGNAKRMCDQCPQPEKKIWER